MIPGFALDLFLALYFFHMTRFDKVYNFLEHRSQKIAQELHSFLRPTTYIMDNNAQGYI